MSGLDRRRDELAHAFDAAWDVAWDAGIEAARSDHYDMRPLNQRDKARREYLAEWADTQPDPVAIELVGYVGRKDFERALKVTDELGNPTTPVDKKPGWRDSMALYALPPVQEEEAGVDWEIVAYRRKLEALAPNLLKRQSFGDEGAA